MNVLDHFAIPYKGLRNGLHEMEFEVDDRFFKEFEDAIVDNGEFKAVLHLDKRTDHSILIFEVEGFTKTSCDRCLEMIKLPVKGAYTLHFKFTEDITEEEDEIVFLHPDTSIVNVAKYIYDIIGISMPMTKIYDCENDPEANCNEAVLAKLRIQEDDTTEENNDLPSPWDGLTGINFEE